MGVAKRTTGTFEQGRAAASARALRAGLALSAVSLLAAVVGALGPAKAVRTTFAWPPRTLPPRTPTTLWYTPLLLSRQRPDSIAARIPCSFPAPLRAAQQPTTVLATARAAETAGGLAVTHEDGHLTVTVGTQVLAELEVQAGGRTDESCAYTLHLDDGRWSLEGGPNAVSLDGSIDPMPVVFGLLSGLDLRSPARPTINVTTAVHDSRTTPLQTVAWMVAVVALLLALVLVAGPRRSRQVWASMRRGFDGAAWHAHLTDAVVVIVLVGWWILAPVVWDDGWVVARERTFSASGGFSTYYDALGVNLPLDYWVEWLHHWVAERTSSVPLLRLHALAALAAMWVLCRWVHSRVAAGAQRRWDPALWGLASAFLVGALAWDMTIRPEPVTALLATGVAACAVRFVERETVLPLAIAALLVPLAVAAHHTGVVALAPVLAVSPGLVRWARNRLVTAGTLVVAAISWGVVLAFVGADVSDRLADARTTSELGITTPWRSELGRYTLLDTFPFATPLRRGSVAFIGLALLAFVSRRRSGRRMLDLPATMLAVAVVLLVVTPSKLPWHFGALAGLVALTVAAEIHRLRDDGSRSQGWEVRPFVAVGAVMVASAWSWSPSDHWNPLDLRSVAWDARLTPFVSFSTLAIALPAIVLGAAVSIQLGRSRQRGRVGAPWRVAAWTAPILAGPLIFFTIAVLGGDFVRSDGWTLTRQSLDSIVGRARCGLADNAVVSLPSSSSALALVADGGPSEPGAWVPPAPVDDVPRYELSSSSPESPWFALPHDKRVGLFVAGWGVSGGLLELQWGRRQGDNFEVLESDVLGDVQPRIETSPWTFLAASELPSPHPDAEVVRIAVPLATPPRAPVAVTAPVTYATTTLSNLTRRTQARTLVHPNLLLYLPCATQPRLADGRVEVPADFVWFDNPYFPQPFEATSPFLGIHDLYAVQRLPLTDGPNPPPGVVVYGIDRRIRGGELVPPTSHTHGS
jgi:hypothetical protein